MDVITAPPPPTKDSTLIDYYMMRRKSIVDELRWIEDYLEENKAIQRRLVVSSTRKRDIRKR